MYEKKETLRAYWIEDSQKSEIPEKNNAIVMSMNAKLIPQFFDKEKFIVFEAEREQAFAPIKQLEGDYATPATAKESLMDLHKQFFVLAGGDFEGDGEFEIDTLMTYAGEGLDDQQGKVV